MLDIEENMNFGKTYSFFHEASAHFPWASQIAKCDLDVFPYLTELLDFVYNASRCSSEYEYWGKGNDNIFNASGTYYINKTGHVVQASSYSPWNRLCAADSCMQSQRSFSNMQGGLYGLS